MTITCICTYMFNITVVLFIPYTRFKKTKHYVNYIVHLLCLRRPPPLIWNLKKNHRRFSNQFQEAINFHSNLIWKFFNVKLFYSVSNFPETTNCSKNTLERNEYTRYIFPIIRERKIMKVMIYTAKFVSVDFTRRIHSYVLKRVYQRIPINSLS